MSEDRGAGPAHAGSYPACCTYVAERAAFVGDTLFMPDFGTARCDFRAAMRTRWTR